MKKEFVTTGFVFFAVALLVTSGVVFNNRLIGRSLDFPVPPVDYLVHNNYTIDFYTWWGTMNGGSRNSFGGALIPADSVLYAPLIFGAGTWFIGRYQIVLTLFLAMFGFYLFSRRLLEDHDLEEKNKKALSFIGSLFFALNNYVFCDIIFGSNVQYFTFVLAPLLLYFVMSHGKQRKTRDFFFAFLVLFVMSSTLQSLVFAYVMILVFSIAYRNYELLPKLALLHVALSLYWILPLLSTSHDIVTTEMAVDYSWGLINSSSRLYSALINSEYFANRNLYNLALNNMYLSYVWFFNAFALLIVSLTSEWNIKFFQKKRDKKLILGLLLVFVISIFFNKGAQDPMGNVVLFLYKQIPAFNLYRSLQHYLSFYTLSISILFLFSGIFLVKKNKKFLYLLAALVILNAMPWWYTRDFGTKNITSTNFEPSYFNQFYLTKGNEDMYALNKLPLEFGIMDAPPGYSINFMAVGENDFNYISGPEGEIKSQGGDDGLYYGNKKFYATDGSANLLSGTLDNLEEDMYTEKDFFPNNKNLLSILGIRYFVVRGDVSPLFSPNTFLFNLGNIENTIGTADNFSSVKTEDFITIAKIKDEDFLPPVYIPEDNIVSSLDPVSLKEITLNSGFKTRSAVYFSSQNQNKSDALSDLNSESSSTELPTVEFKKIDPTKYRIIVHNASSTFSLVLGEAFSNSWTAYLTQDNKETVDSRIQNFKILSGSEEDQASATELQEYINNNWVSDLGKGTGDFISKNFNGTIQNNNLDNGNFWETWELNPLQDTNHLVANGYANSWTIDPNEICLHSAQCVKNADGSYDMEFVIEYWPQRLFYIGAIISGAILLGCFGYLGYDFAKRRKKKNEI